MRGARLAAATAAAGGALSPAGGRTSSELQQRRGGSASGGSTGGGEEGLYEGFEQLASSSAVLQTVTGGRGGSGGGGFGGGGGIPSSAGGSQGFGLAAPGAVGSLRPPTSQFGGQVGGAGAGPARPMTSVHGAGYSSVERQRSVFDPLQQGGAGSDFGPAPPLQKRSEDSPQLQALELERAVHALLEQTQELLLAGDAVRALEKAREAGKRERHLCRHRERNDMADQQNGDLTFAVMFSLANAYAANQMLTDAFTTYNLVVKNKTHPLAGRLRVNLGGLYMQQKNYPAAIKMYRMALDLIGQTSLNLRFKVLRNIGNAFVRLGQFQEAIESYEAVLELHADVHAAFNLLVCYYALGDRDRMKRGFEQLLNCEPLLDVEGEEERGDDEADVRDALPPASAGGAGPGAGGPDVLVAEDELSKDLRARRRQLCNAVRKAAALVAPVVERDFAAGYAWVVEQLQAPRAAGAASAAAATASAVAAATAGGGAASAGGGGVGGGAPSSPMGAGAAPRPRFPHIAMEMEIAKGIAFMKQKDIGMAIQVFKSFERKDSGLIAQAATNLSFLHFLEGDLKSAERYADTAVRADRYNAKALVNKANVLFVSGRLEEARELYLEAIGVEADCVEAIYNLGLANKRMGQLEDALQAFKKLHRIVPREPLVVFHIANLFDLLDDAASATEWFKIVEGAVHTDPRVLMRLGALYLKQKDENQAYQSYAESYQLYPVNMEVLSWLGVWFVRNELFENAIPFFERAAEIEPKELKWRLMVASCYRRLGALQQALDIYREVHSLDPDNVECLTFLCSLTKDANPAEHERFAALLIQAQQRAAQAQREQALSRESARTPVPDPAAGAATDDAAASSPTPPPALAQQQQQQQQHAPSLQRASSSAPRSPAAELDPRFRERVSAEREAQGIRLQRPADGGKTGDEFNDVDVNDMLPLS